MVGATPEVFNAVNLIEKAFFSLKLQDCSSQTTIVDLFSKKSKETVSNDVISLCESLEKSGFNESNSIQIKVKLVIMKV